MLLEYLQKEESLPDETFKRKKVDICKTGNDIRSGSECVFIPTSETEGLKTYKDKDEALAARLCQQEACKFEIGPKVLSGVMELIFPMSTMDQIDLKSFYAHYKAFGYYTQLASQKCFDKDHSIYQFDKDLEALKDKAHNKLSFYCYDIRDCNVGYIEDHLVMIDFGHLTTLCSSPQEKATVAGQKMEQKAIAKKSIKTGYGKCPTCSQILPLSDIPKKPTPKKKPGAFVIDSLHMPTPTKSSSPLRLQQCLPPNRDSSIVDSFLREIEDPFHMAYKAANLPMQEPFKPLKLSQLRAIQKQFADKHPFFGMMRLAEPYHLKIPEPIKFSYKDIPVRITPMIFRRKI